MKKRLGILLFLSILILPAFGQEEDGKLELKGYASSLTNALFSSLKDPFQTDYVIHNRLNFKAYISQKLTFAAEARNRFFMGDMVKTGNFYSDMISFDRGFVDMSWNLANEHSFFINTTLDRLWIDYSTGKFQATAGRQRINWGQTLVWNPNDIFNAYSYFDFDYVERPGSDAVRLQYYPASSSAIELAMKADKDNEITAAALYRFNKWSYDIQFLAGVFESDELVAGFGWSGAIGSVSFRGEGSLFSPFKNFADTSSTGMLTLGADKIFGNNSMLQAQVMFSNNPYNFENIANLYSSENLSVKSLAFSKFSAFVSYSYPVTPLFTTALSAMWFPDLEGFFTGISIDYSVAENIDLTLLWQHFDGKFSLNERTKINLGFLRIKFSF